MGHFQDSAVHSVIIHRVGDFIQLQPGHLFFVEVADTAHQNVFILLQKLHVFCINLYDLFLLTAFTAQDFAHAGQNSAVFLLCSFFYQLQISVFHPEISSQNQHFAVVQFTFLILQSLSHIFGSIF